MAATIDPAVQAQADGGETTMVAVIEINTTGEWKHIPGFSTIDVVRKDASTVYQLGDLDLTQLSAVAADPDAVRIEDTSNWLTYSEA